MIFITFCRIIFYNILVHPSISSFNHASVHYSSSSGQMDHNKNEITNTGFLSRRNVTGHSLNDQHASLNFQSSPHFGRDRSTDTPVQRNTTTGFNKPVTMKQPFEQLQSRRQSAFYRPLPGQKDVNFNQPKSSSQYQLHSQTANIQKSMQNDAMNGYQRQSPTIIKSHSLTRPECYSCTKITLNNVSPLFIVFVLHSSANLE